METVVDKWRKEGRQVSVVEGWKEASMTVALLQLQRKLGALKPTVEAQIRGLSADLLQELSLALLDFSKP